MTIDIDHDPDCAACSMYLCPKLTEDANKSQPKKKETVKTEQPKD